jgi:hypothetical protein
VFDIVLRAAVRREGPAGAEQGVVLSVRRAVTIPAHYSVAKRERAQMKTLEQLINDLDAATLNSLYRLL